ncbi:MAG: AarF/ABC1/UbiB kinase family protein [Pseudomonadota bacterium]
MVDGTYRGRPVPIPSRRLSRLAGFGRMSAEVAGRALLDGARSLGQGERPKPADLLLTPPNILRITDELAKMRGAALKLGQMLSMDAGEILPPELSELMARLRADADFIDAAQLETVMTENLGSDWRTRFDHFEPRPIAAASIGQVHRARTVDGRDLAIKVQYPGVTESIDSDVDNVMALFRLTGLGPPKASIAPLISESKAQLHHEADYIREAANLRRFRSLVPGDGRFVLPEVQDDLSTGKVLAMSFVSGQPIETVGQMSAAVRQDVYVRLVRLALDEIFSFGFAQTDPNFANYLYDPQNDTIGLLDFGATREIPTKMMECYRRFLRAGLDGNRKELKATTMELGVYRPETQMHHRNMIDRVTAHLFGAIRRDRMFDFANDALMRELRSIGTEIAMDRSFAEVPPVELMYLQRKMAGLFFLGRRFRVPIPAREILEEYAA